MHRQAIRRGCTSYEPNSLGGGCPFQAGAAGFQSYRGPVDAEPDKVRGKGEKFAEHYAQATLFWNSQSQTEKNHIVAAFRFELSRVQTPAIRQRMVSGLMNVASELAELVAQGLGLAEMPQPTPKVLNKAVKPEVAKSQALSLLARPGDGSIATRRIAILVAQGSSADVVPVAQALEGAGAVPRYLSSRLGGVKLADGSEVEIDGTLETLPSVLFDAVVIPDGQDAVEILASDGRTARISEGSIPSLQTHTGIWSGTDAAAKGRDSCGFAIRPERSRPDRFEWRSTGCTQVFYFRTCGAQNV